MRLFLSIIASLASLIVLPIVMTLDICDDCPSPGRFWSPGVGFDLSINHGTSAVYFLNGTIATVAKIEGSPSYKHEMRRRTEESLLLYQQTELAPKMFTPYASKSGWIGKKKDFFLQLIRCLHLTETPPRPPITGMLQALKVSTEVFLSQEIHFVELVVPLSPPSPFDEQVQSLDSLLLVLGLSRTNQRQTSASAAASRGYGIRSSDRRNGHLEYVFSIDYSRAGLMLTLDELDKGVLEEKSRSWRGDLGADDISGTPDYWGVVENQVREFVKQSDRREVDHLVLIGESVLAEPRMLQVVKTVVGEKALARAMLGSRTESRQGLKVDPVFAAAIGSASMWKENVFQSPEGCTYAGSCQGSEIARDEL